MLAKGASWSVLAEALGKVGEAAYDKALPSSSLDAFNRLLPNLSGSASWQTSQAGSRATLAAGPPPASPVAMSVGTGPMIASPGAMSCSQSGFAAPSQLQSKWARAADDCDPSRG
jgi:hypothetical protein